MALQTPNIMRWTRYMDECLEVLEMSPVSLPSDKTLCLHIRLQHILEDFEQQFASSVVGPTAAKVTYRAFKRQLAAACTTTPRAWHGKPPSKRIAVKGTDDQQIRSRSRNIL